MDRHEAANDMALARLFRVWPDPVSRCGTDLVNEAIGEDYELRKLIAEAIYDACNERGEVDWADLGPRVEARLLNYAQSLPKFEDYYAEALVDVAEKEAA